MASVIRNLAPSELDWANSRYEDVNFLASPASDRIAVAEVHGVPAGLARVTEVAEGVGELGGIYVFAEHRGAGLSRLLIQFFIDESRLKTLYCLPFSHLRSLYESLGFRVCLPHVLIPDKIVEKHAWCNGYYPQPVLVMRWASD